MVYSAPAGLILMVVICYCEFKGMSSDNSTEEKYEMKSHHIDRVGQ